MSLLMTGHGSLEQTRCSLALAASTAGSITFQGDWSDLLWDIARAALGTPQLFPPFGLMANYWKASSASPWLLQFPKIFTKQRWERIFKCSESLPAQVLCPVQTCWFGINLTFSISRNFVLITSSGE